MSRKSRPVVSDLNTKSSVSLFHPNFDEARSGARRDSVTDSVLYDRLQDKIRHLRVESLMRHIHAGYQTVLKADAFDLQVTTEEFDLLFQGHFLRAGVVQSESKKIPQTGNHLAGRRGVVAEQGGD